MPVGDARHILSSVPTRHAAPPTQAPEERVVDSSTCPLLSMRRSDSDALALQAPTSPTIPVVPSVTHRRSRHPVRPPRERPHDKVPAYMLCPLSGELMQDPVILEDGYSYERRHLVAWLKTRRCSPKTLSPLASTKFFDNDLLRDAIDARNAWLQTNPRPPAHKAWLPVFPIRSVYPFTEPLCLSDGTTYDSTQLGWLDGKRTSPTHPQRPFRHDELPIPNLAVAAMVEDAGFPACNFQPYTRKYKLWAQTPRVHHADCCCASTAAGFVGAFADLGILKPIAVCAGLDVSGTVMALSAAAACVAGVFGTGVLYSGLQVRSKQAEEERQAKRPKFTGP